MWWFSWAKSWIFVRTGGGGSGGGSLIEREVKGKGGFLKQELTISDSDCV
jgi:hypothetical protein